MRTDKTSHTELHRTFLVHGLPEPLTRASSHLQIFDNYIPGTRLRLRSVRVPETKEWTISLQQRFPLHEGDGSEWKVAEIHLNNAEYEHFKMFEGNEIRKNRYFHEFDGKMFAFDVYLGPLWGLNRARVEFDTREELLAYDPPPFAIFEVTNDPFFFDDNLYHRKFEEIQGEVAKIGDTGLITPEFPDE